MIDNSQLSNVLTIEKEYGKMDTQLWKIEQLIKAHKALSNALANIAECDTPHNVTQLQYELTQAIYKIIHDLTDN